MPFSDFLCIFCDYNFTFIYAYRVIMRWQLNKQQLHARLSMSDSADLCSGRVYSGKRSGQPIWDQQGKEYVDFAGGIAVTGWAIAILRW